MTPEETRLLTDTYTRLISDRTGTLYIDEDFSTHFFSRYSDTKKYIKTCKNVTPGKHPEHIEPEHLKQELSNIYMTGIRKITVHKKDGSTEEIVLNEDDMENRFYNNKLCGLVNRLVHTSELRYLRNMYDCYFIIPIIIDRRKPEHYPKVHYSEAVGGNGEKFFTLFTTLEEYRKWAGMQTKGMGWRPLQVKRDNIDDIRRGGNVIIDPLSSKIILNNSQFLLMRPKNVNEEIDKLNENERSPKPEKTESEQKKNPNKKITEDSDIINRRRKEAEEQAEKKNRQYKKRNNRNDHKQGQKNHHENGNTSKSEKPVKKPASEKQNNDDTDDMDDISINF